MALFKTPENNFTTTVNHCLQTEYGNIITLSPAEMQQLFLYKSNSLSGNTTPENRQGQQEQLNVDVKRALIRLYSLALLQNATDSAYELFTLGQPKNIKLHRTAFDALALDLKKLSTDELTALRVSCLLTTSIEAKDILKNNKFTPPEDSEEFLTWVAAIQPNDNRPINSLPIAKTLTEKQKDTLLQLYPANAHFRWLLYTECGLATPKAIFELSSDKDKFNLWLWRWRLNMMGFKDQPITSMQYTQELHRLCETVLDTTKNKTNDAQTFLQNYTILRAKIASDKIQTLSNTEQYFFGHIVASFNEINVVAFDMGNEVLKGYLIYKTQRDTNSQVSENYQKFLINQNTLTPTYVPSVLNSSFALLNTNSTPSTPANLLSTHEISPISAATIFMCQLQRDLFNYLLANPEAPRVSCRSLGCIKGGQLPTILTSWLQRQDLQCSFTFIPNGKELEARVDMSQFGLPDDLSSQRTTKP